MLALLLVVGAVVAAITGEALRSRVSAGGPSDGDREADLRAQFLSMETAARARVGTPDWPRGCDTDLQVVLVPEVVWRECEQTSDLLSTPGMPVLIERACPYPWAGEDLAPTDEVSSGPGHFSKVHMQDGQFTERVSFAAGGRPPPPSPTSGVFPVVQVDHVLEAESEAGTLLTIFCSDGKERQTFTRADLQTAAQVQPPPPPPSQPAPVVEGCPQEPTERVSGEQAARCFYEAWVQADRSLATVYASEEAVAALFEFEFGPPAWEFEGCAANDDGSGSCHWFVPDEGHGVAVEMFLGGSPSAGNTVERIEFYG